VGIISWILVGLLAGALGKLIMPGDDPGGIIVTTLIGMVGAIVGGSSWAYSAAAGRRGSTSGQSSWPRSGPSYCSPSTGSSWVAGRTEGTPPVSGSAERSAERDVDFGCRLGP
jgi:uncharacterized membrane protein YeaQ/YmgE (transglycosylase-associated protein family)